MFDFSGIGGFIFDCDGTLLDSMPAWNATEEALCEQASRELTRAEMDEVRSAPIDEAARIFHERYGVGKSAQAVLSFIDNSLLSQYRDSVTAIDGACEFLSEVRAHKIPAVVVTSSPRRYVEAGLARTGMLDTFVEVITTDEVGLSKRDPAIYERAMQAMGSTAATTWGVDDALYAVRVMDSMGIHTIAPYDCDETAGSFADLSAAAEIAVHSLSELL